MPVCKYCLDHFGTWEKTKEHEKYCSRNPNKKKKVDIPVVKIEEVKEIIVEPEVKAEPVKDDVIDNSFLSAMTVSQLKDMAEEKGIDISGLRKKDDIIKAIIGA